MNDLQAGEVVAATTPIEFSALTALDDDPVGAAARELDSSMRAAIAQATLGLSPAAIAEAWMDWGAHLATAPGKQAWLTWKAARKAVRFGEFLTRCAVQGGKAAPCIEPLPGDHRFVDVAWRDWPFNAWQQGFLLCQQWLHNATTDVRGMSTPHENIVNFMSRQVLDMLAPSNFLLTNPVALRRTAAEQGANLVRGGRALFEDLVKTASPAAHGPVNAAVGRDVAVTTGKVVYRNHLIELIQYSPTTGQVAPEPVLLVPAWIMKYYILDLSPGNSLVRYLVGAGFTVFMLSWRNPLSGDRDLGMADYLEHGVMAAITAACAVSGSASLHATGYCLGGTLLSIAAAAMARDGDERLRSITLFAAQQDFTEAGELTLFINASQVALLEDMMRQQGVLEARQMAGAFQILQSNDLVWSHAIQSYLLGEQTVQTDLMAWNADTTRMPARMHSEYLRQLFLDNLLAEGHYKVDDRPVAVSDIQVPIFVVGTERDHIAPWRSVHKIHLLTSAEVTFVLTKGGHNAGIVSEPGHPGRSFLQLTRVADGHYVAPDAWLTKASRVEGSWWPAWTEWLHERSGPPQKPPALGASGYPVLEDAPGSYVLQT